MTEEGIVVGICLLLPHKGKGSKAVEHVLCFFCAFGVDQLMKGRALFKVAAECLPKVKVASLRGALEDSNKSIGLSLLKITTRYSWYGRLLGFFLMGVASSDWAFFLHPQVSFGSSSIVGRISSNLALILLEPRHRFPASYLGGKRRPGEEQVTNLLMDISKLAKELWAG
ncbi:hypothetical protein DSO57_1039698 [Entomophthora muscae]|uniref:Uncharacterized protein n=1 Tax=Entomophthora muscae TaxID=34485 RepID=A0ACC2SPG1_9FUNG|nr:hypothetical protein DSO57_1039698 [Entomophthora muscae]